MIETSKRITPLLFKPHLVLMMLIFAAAAAAGAMLLPGDAERVAMLERDGDNKRALALLEQRFASGDRSQRTLFQLEQLYQHFGQLPKARAMLELLARSRPRDHVLQRRLVKFYRDTQDGDAYLSGLSRLIAHRYSEPACRELIAQLRLIGQYARERDAIERCRIKGYRRGSDIIRLAELEAANGNKPRALSLLRNVDDVKGLASPRERLMLTSLLLDSGGSDEVADRGTRWVASQDSAAFTDTLISFLGQRKAHDAAIRIASQAGRPGDGLSLAVAELMLDRDQTSAARAYLRGWIERAELKSETLATRFIAASLDAEDPEVALLAARRFGMNQLPEKSLVEIAEALGATGRRDEFETVRMALSADTLVAHPLLSAMVELNKGATSTTQSILEGVSSDALETWRLALWARLMRETGKGAVADAKLRALGARQPAAVAAAAEAGKTAAEAESARPEIGRRTHRASSSAVVRLRSRNARLRALDQRKAQLSAKRASKRAKADAQRTYRSKLKRRARPPRNYLARPKPVSRPAAEGS